MQIKPTKQDAAIARRMNKLAQRNYTAGSYRDNLLMSTYWAKHKRLVEKVQFPLDSGNKEIVLCITENDLALIDLALQFRGPDSMWKKGGILAAKLKSQV